MNCQDQLSLRLPPSTILRMLLFALMASRVSAAQPLEQLGVSDDGTHFVRVDSGDRFVVWGVNYDHDASGRLLEEYWVDEWESVVEDFHEIKALGANVVRIHLQVGSIMEAPNKADAAALARLGKLIELAEETGLYLDLTGLACYHKSNIPPWFDDLGEQQRWAVQAAFWQAVAQVGNDSSAVFCYDLMNEPLLPGKKPDNQWLAGELGGKFFAQRITLDLQGRTREQVAEAWTRTMVAAIRQHDEKHMITVGAIPWVFVFGGGKPLFHGPQVGKHLDFVAIHVYPQKGEVDQALAALNAYELGKPLVVEEMFPLKCSADELAQFVNESSDRVDGWISFYWGQTPEQLRSQQAPTIGDAMTAAWLEKYRELSHDILPSRP